jgi:hypothetical protein
VSIAVNRLYHRLALKVLLFGQVFLVSSLMALFYAPAVAIFDHMRQEGSAPELGAAANAGQSGFCRDRQLVPVARW